MLGLLTWVKRIFFEKGRLIYWANILKMKKSLRRILGNKKSDAKIKIGIIYQEPITWAVIEPIYQKALADPEIDISVVLVPKMDFKYYLFTEAIHTEKIYELGKDIEGKVYKSYDAKTNTWLDLEKLEFDYIFMMRPYETYLPSCYRASSLAKYSKVCYIPYAYSVLDDFEYLYNSHFIRNVYSVFCEKQSSFDYVNTRYAAGKKAGIQKFVNAGYPKYDGISNYIAKESELWKREKTADRQRIVWTPRWTVDARLGGSNFLKYKDAFKDYVSNNEAADFVFRPHPMTFDYMKTAGLMSQEEIDSYKCFFKESDRANLDDRRDYYDMFFSSDVLVSDVSSIIWDYIFTGNPIVYCPTTPNSTNITPDLKECMYFAESFEDICKYLAQLREGNDPLKEKRQLLKKELSRGGDIAGSILTEIKKDYASL